MRQGRLLAFGLAAGLLIPAIASAAITGANLNVLGAKVFTDTGGVAGIRCKDQLDSSGTCPIEVYTVNGSSSLLQGTYSSPQPTLSPGQSAALSLDVNNNLNVDVQQLPSATTPPNSSATPTITGTSTVVFNSNINRHMFNICNPLLVNNAANNQEIYFDVFGNAAVTTAPDNVLLPGQCWAPDAVPATSNQISAIETPLPGATASSVPIRAEQQ